MHLIESSRHSPQAAWVMANMSDIAYLDESGVAHQVESFFAAEYPGLEVGVRFYSMPETDSQCFLVTCSEFAVLSFRGTENGNLRDYLSDIRVTQTGGPFRSNHSHVHRGFWAAAQSVIRNEYLMHDVWLSTMRGQPLFLTGHSLGGALATLVSAALTNLGQPSQCVYTFGSPRVGNRGFAALYDHEVPASFRYVYQNDLVTRFPWLCGYYRHLGKLCFIDDQMQTEINPSLWAYWVKRYKPALRGLVSFFSGGLGDHSVKGYVAATAAQVCESE